MKIIESKPNINWRNIKSNVEIQNVIKEFDELLNNESFNGIKKNNRTIKVALLCRKRCAIKFNESICSLETDGIQY